VEVGQRVASIWCVKEKRRTTFAPIHMVLSCGQRLLLARDPN